MSKPLPMIGRTFGRLTVIARAGAKSDRPAWRVQCTCGTERIVDGRNLRAGYTRSCGCLQREASRREEARP